MSSATASHHCRGPSPQGDGSIGNTFGDGTWHPTFTVTPAGRPGAARGPGARNAPVAVTRAVPWLVRHRALPVTGPFVAVGRAVPGRGRTADPDWPRRPALWAGGGHAGSCRLNPRPSWPHPPQVSELAASPFRGRCSTVGVPCAASRHTGSRRHSSRSPVIRSPTGRDAPGRCGVIRPATVLQWCWRDRSTPLCISPPVRQRGSAASWAARRSRRGGCRLAAAARRPRLQPLSGDRRPAARTATAAGTEHSTNSITTHREDPLLDTMRPRSAPKSARTRLVNRRPGRPERHHNPPGPVWLQACFATAGRAVNGRSWTFDAGRPRHPARGAYAALSSRPRSISPCSMSTTPPSTR